MGSRVLITGNLGYLGPVVTEGFRKIAWQTVGIDTGWYVQDYIDPPVFADVQAPIDIRDSWLLGGLFDVDVVVHLAGLSNDPLSEMSPALTGEINRTGTIELIRRYPKARHVVVSSASVYGASGRIMSEGDPTEPLTPYAMAKLDVDEWLQRHPEINSVSLRFGTLFGYSPGLRLDLVLNRMKSDAQCLGQFTVGSDALRPLLHVDDAAWVIRRMAKDWTLTGIYNVAVGNYTVPELGAMVAKRFPDAEMKRTGSHDHRSYGVSTDKLRAVLGVPYITPEVFLADEDIGFFRPKVRLDRLKELVDRNLLEGRTLRWLSTGRDIRLGSEAHR